MNRKTALIIIGLVVALVILLTLKNNLLSPNSSSNPTPEPTTTVLGSPAPEQVDKASDIYTAVREAAIKENYAIPIINIEKTTDIQASGQLRDQGVAGGAKWFAVFHDGVWMVIHIGNGLPKCSDLSHYQEQITPDFLTCVE